MAVSTSSVLIAITQLGQKVVVRLLPLISIFHIKQLLFKPTTPSLSLTSIKLAQQVHFLANDDIATPTALVGKKVAPIFQYGDIVMGESLDIIAKVDTDPKYGKKTHDITYHIILNHIISYHIISVNIGPHHITPHSYIPHHITLHHITSHHIISH